MEREIKKEREKKERKRETSERTTALPASRILM